MRNLASNITLNRPQAHKVDKVACIGTGTIGGAWVAHFLRRGYQVRAWDKSADTQGRLRQSIETLWPTLEALGLAPGASVEKLTLSPSLESALEDVAFVQESVFEDMTLKIETLSLIDALANRQAVIASSTSGFSMTDMQTACTHPERTVVGHPFHPVYMIPLVEVVPGEKTDNATVDWAMSFYAASGKSPVKARDGVYGYIANRLQLALWNEALHMVAAGEASVADIDRAVAEGPGLRWAMHGPSLTFHLAGGPGGIYDYVEKKSAAVRYDPYSRLAPPLFDKKLINALVEGCEEQAHGKSVEKLSTERDRFLIELLRLKEQMLK